MESARKGGVSLYGLGRFPVTLYAEQWDKLLNAGEELRTFVQQQLLPIPNPISGVGGKAAGRADAPTCRLVRDDALHVRSCTPPTPVRN